MARRASRTRTQEARPLLLRLPARQRAALKEAAQAMGLTESAYLRRALSVVLRLDAFTSEPPLYQQWFHDGLRDLFAAANLAAVTAQALLALARDQMVREAQAQTMPQVLAEEQAENAIAVAMAAGREGLVEPGVRATYGSLQGGLHKEATESQRQSLGYYSWNEHPDPGNGYG